MRVNSALGSNLYKTQSKLANANKNKQEGMKFLSSNKMRTGVKVLSSGLQYKVIEKGEGPKPKAADKVKVNYKGSFINGQIFDSSYDRGKPTEFSLRNVIKGWQEGITKMPVGSKFHFFIPPDLAYGENGSGSIGPNQTLVFEVELLEINPKK